MQLEERQAAITSKTAIAWEGSKVQKNERDLERSICEQVLFRCAAAVCEKANGRATYEARAVIVNLSKFSLYKKAEPVGVIVPPIPIVKMSNAIGTLMINWKANRNVSGWIIQHIAGTDVSPLADWRTIATVTRSKYVATGLPSGYHSFRLIALSAIGESVPSEAVAQFAR